MLIVTIGGIGFAVVWVSNRQEIPYTGRMHCILVSPSNEQVMGTNMFRQITSQAAAQGKLVSPQHPAARLVSQVGQRIAKVASNGKGGGFRDHMQHLEWEFAVIKSPDANAFVVPGGKVVVFTGLLELVTTKDELAAVLAHESAHVLARHAAERMTSQQVLSIFQVIMYQLFDIPVPGGLLSLAFFLPNSRKQEHEADAIGMQLAAQACFDPGAAASVFQKLEQVEKKGGADTIPKFLRTHPVTAKRIKEVQANLPAAEMTFWESGCGVKNDFMAGWVAGANSDKNSNSSSSSSAGTGYGF